jgi:hypothetical protein
MTKTYVIADLHGRYDLLELGMRTIVHDTSFFHSGDSIVTLGDYVDRGPQSRQIIEYLMAMQRDLGSRLICLKGNHEDLTRLRGGTERAASGKKSPRSARPHCDQKCLPTGHIFALGCRSRLAEMSRKAAKYRIDSVACRYL